MQGDLVARLNMPSLQVLKRSDVREGMVNLGLEPRANMPEEYSVHPGPAIDRMGWLVETMGLPPDTM